jgi:GNAT superfamily N-acetyltransferase
MVIDDNGSGHSGENTGYRQLTHSGETDQTNNISHTIAHGIYHITSALRWRRTPPLWQTQTMEIRDATPDDAIAGCVVLKRSIGELCIRDHKNDPAILARWLGNKTTENFAAWAEQRDNSLLVAVEDGHILAVGSVTDAGTIGLNYVSPDARFRGVSRALLQALELRAVERGNTRCNLISTETARQFYLSNGYVESRSPSDAFGTGSGYPMSKHL